MVGSELKSIIEQAALNAGRYIVEKTTSGDVPEVWTKDDHTLVMNVDLESQRRIMEVLGSSIPIVAEEDEATHPLIDSEDTYFLIDPLDGTTSCRRFWAVRGGQVGFGPLVGLVEKGRLAGCAFYAVPQRTLYVAYAGEGLYGCTVDFDAVPVPPALSARERIVAANCPELVRAGVLFYVGGAGEAQVVEFLRKNNAIENLYRFGGFASDCARLARGYEQMNIQFSVKPWDFSAALLAREAKMDVILDPLGTRVDMDDWKIRMNNPLMIVNPGMREELFNLLAGFVLR